MQRLTPDIEPPILPASSVVMGALRALALTLCLLSVLTRPALAETPVVSCHSGAFSVSAEDRQEADLACAIIEKTHARLAQLGFEMLEPARVEITSALDVAQGVCVGLYNAMEKKLQILSRSCLQDQTAHSIGFAEMDTDLLFETVLVHELVHAHIDQHSSGRFLPRVAHEYLAYSIQLDLLPETDRTRILDKAQIAAPIVFDEISASLLQFSPIHFAAMAWMHFDQEGADSDLVDRILRGDLMFNTLWE